MKKIGILILLICIFFMYNFKYSESNTDKITNISKTIALSQEKDKGYNISTKTFKHMDNIKQISISINYPQIIDLEDVMLQNNINKLIKDTALEPYYDFLAMESSIFDETECPVVYSVVYISRKIISIKFEGYIYSKGSAHGTNLIYTANINLSTGEKIIIRDLFDESFNNKINHQYFKGVDVDTSISDAGAIDEIFNRFKIDVINGCNNFYFGTDKFFIILPIGNYYQFAANYDDLIDCMKLENPVWSEVLNSTK